MSFFDCVLGHSSPARLPKHLAVMRFGGGRDARRLPIPDPSRHREGGRPVGAHRWWGAPYLEQPPVGLVSTRDVLRGGTSMFWRYVATPFGSQVCVVATGPSVRREPILHDS